MKGYTGIGQGIAATIGGLLITTLGFNFTFIIVSVMGITSTIILSKIKY